MRPHGPKTSKVLMQHVRKRALERFAIEITKDEVSQILKSIRTGKAKFLHRQSLVVTHWQVRLREQDVAVVYDKKRKMIRTVLPLEFY